MRAAQSALDASAHNIANLATPGFRREQAIHSTLADTGVTTSWAQAAQAAQAGNAIESDMVGQLVAKNQFLANLAVFKTQDQMMGALLDATS